jgi:glutamate 5-kinase
MRNFKNVKRVVVKIGTNILSGRAGIDSAFIGRVANQVSGLLGGGMQVVIVSSGAIGLGAGELGMKGPVFDLRMRQGCAAIGQPLLMDEYRRAFKRHGIKVGQVLVTAEVLSHRKTYLNLREAVESLLKLGTVPIMNENDCVSTEEIGSAFGDNDRLSALIASKIDADLLIILSDIECLYDKDPRNNDDAKEVRVVYEVSDEIERMAGKSGSVHARGGMRTKLEAAKIAADAGCRMVLADGRGRNVIGRIMEGREVGTVFLAKRRLSNRVRWILNSRTAGTILVDEGAERAVRRKKSLLPSGIESVRGNFDAGSVVGLNDFGKAVTSLSSSELRAVLGKHSREIGRILGGERRDVVATPDDIVLFE